MTMILSAQDIVTYSKGAINDSLKFNDIMELSDGTFLIAGETQGNLSWTGVVPTVMQTKSLKKDSFPDKTTGFILHMTKDMKTVSHCIIIPDSLVENIYKIRTNSKIGEATGSLYISGKCRNDSAKGYFIAKLDKNFLNGVPAKCDWLKYVIANDIDNFNQFCYYNYESHHRIEQPWDVDNLGRVVYVERTEFTHSKWVRILRLKANGAQDYMPDAFYQDFFYSYDSNAYDSKSSLNFVDTTLFHPLASDSIKLRLHFVDKTGADSIAFRTVKPDSIISSYMFKHGGTAGRAIRSLDKAGMLVVNTDENGNQRKAGNLPYDYIYKYPFYDPVNYPTQLNSIIGNGVYDHNPASGQMNTARIGDITIDRRNNNVYFGATMGISNGAWQYSFYNNFPCINGALIDLESFVVAMNDSGKINWWARTYQTDARISQAAQLIDKLAIDYKNDKLVVLGRTYDTAVNNFWEGNKLIANPGGHGFKNRYTGLFNETEYSWLGKFDLDTLSIRRSTYIAEYRSNYRTSDSLLGDPNLDGWADPNRANSNIGKTVCHDMKVDTSGNVYVACYGERTITTIDAYQKMIKPDRDMSMDSVASANNFVRIYNSDLNNIYYSSLITGEWDPLNGEGGNNTHINRLLISGRHLYAVGYHSGSGFDVATLNVPSWGDDQINSQSALFAKLDLFAKLRITSSPSVVAKNKAYAVNFILPSNYSLSASNEFRVLLSDNTGTFNTSTVIGILTGNSSGTVNITIPAITALGKHRIQLIASDSAIYSTPATLFVLDTLDVLALNKPIGDTIACVGQKLRYTANKSGVNNYLWSIYPSNAGSITALIADTAVDIKWNSSYKGIAKLLVKVMGITANTGNDTIFISDTLRVAFESFENAVVVMHHDTLYARPSGSGYSYQWYNSILIINGATDSIYRAKMSNLDRMVWVRVTTANGCSDSSAKADPFLGINELSRNKALKIYPNPTKNELFIELPASDYGDLRILLNDQMGRILIDKNYKSDGLSNLRLDLNGISPGFYWIRIETSSGKYVDQVIKQ